MQDGEWCGSDVNGKCAKGFYCQSPCYDCHGVCIEEGSTYEFLAVYIDTIAFLLFTFNFILLETRNNLMMGLTVNFSLEYFL